MELAASTSALPHAGYAGNNGGGGGAAGSGGGGKASSPNRTAGHPYPSGAHVGVNGTPNSGRKRYSGSGHAGFDPAIAALSSGYSVGSSLMGSGAMGAGGVAGLGAGSGPGGPGGGGVGGVGGGGGGSARARGGVGSALRVCGSSTVRVVPCEDGEVVSVHHFNTELGSPLVYGTRKGVVRSWDLRAREVRRGALARAGQVRGGANRASVGSCRRGGRLVARGVGLGTGRFTRVTRGMGSRGSRRGCPGRGFGRG